MMEKKAFKIHVRTAGLTRLAEYLRANPTFGMTFLVKDDRIVKRNGILRMQEKLFEWFPEYPRVSDRYLASLMRKFNDLMKNPGSMADAPSGFRALERVYNEFWASEGPTHAQVDDDGEETDLSDKLSVSSDGALAAPAAEPPLAWPRKRVLTFHEMVEPMSKMAMEHGWAFIVDPKRRRFTVEFCAEGQANDE